MLRKILILLLIAFFSGCQTSPDGDAKKIISVSILPQKYFVEVIAGDKFRINVMIPPGGTPETYEPTARQMQSLSQSGIYLKIGNIPFEEIWMKSFVNMNSGMKIYDLSEGIELITGDVHHDGTAGSGVDPHIWSSVKNAGIICENIFDALIKEDPVNKDYYSSRLQKFLCLTDSLDMKFKTEFAPISGSAFLVFHPALAYLARDYGLEQISLEFEGKSPPPGHMKDIINIAREKNIKAILIQKQFNAEPAKTIADEIGGKVIIIDPLDENWKDQIEYITESILNIIVK
jgi:zinc transport system substrate-binding protein